MAGGWHGSESAILKGRVPTKGRQIVDSSMSPFNEIGMMTFRTPGHLDEAELEHDSPGVYPLTQFLSSHEISWPCMRINALGPWTHQVD